MSSIIEGCDPFTQPSFTLGNRLLRGLWTIIYTTLFRYSPKPFHPWRCFLLRCFGAKLGKQCHIYPSARIWAPWNLEMQDNACLAEGVNCYSMNKITIGKKSVVSQGCHLCCGTHDYEDRNFRLVTKPITIGSHVWIAVESFVGPGVTIPDGVVIGARSVVVKDMPAWQVCAGNPCKPIKPRVYRP